MESLKNVLFEVREHIAHITLFLHQAIHRFARMRAPVEGSIRQWPAHVRRRVSRLTAAAKPTRNPRK